MNPRQRKEQRARDRKISAFIVAVCLAALAGNVYLIFNL